MHRISKDRQREQSKHAIEDNRLRDDKFNLIKEKKRKQKKKIIIISVAVLLLLGSWIVYGFLSPGKYDDFAKCLTDKGVVMFGEDWCKYTKAQKGMFGKSFKYIDYQQDPNLEIRPTWIIDGQTHETVQSFDTLAVLTGCSY